MNALADVLSVGLLRLRVLELALHGDVSWSMRADGDRVAMATVEVFDDCVVFSSKLTGPLPESFTVVLEADGDPRLAFPARIPFDALEGEVATIRYRLAIETPVLA